MADVKWIKLMVDVFSNRKIEQIEVMPDGDGIIVIWFKLLCLAGNINREGDIYFTTELPYTEEMLATHFRRPLALVKLALRVFVQFRMVEIVNDIIKISNWDKYQSVDRMSEIREYNRLAQRKHREQKRLAAPNKTRHPSSSKSVNDMSMTSQRCQGTDIDIKNIPPIPPAGGHARRDKTKTDDPMFARFWAEYPRKSNKPGAAKAFARIAPDEGLLLCMLGAIRKQKSTPQWTKDNGQYIPHPATWLNQERWNDEFGRAHEQEDSLDGYILE